MDAVEEIKSRLAIDELVGRYVDLKRSGSSLKGLCPFHQEKTPSFYVSPNRGSFHCFGCGKGGDIFSFVMEMERLAFPDALRRLAEQTGVALPEKDEQRPSLTKQLYQANEVALRFFRDVLDSPRGQAARDYLESRAFGREAIERFELGFAAEGRDMLGTALRAAGIEDRLALAAGLVLADEDSGRFRDRFRGRLMFPIRDASKRIVGFGGRVIGEGQPKYLNSPQTEIFDKSSVLFGIHRAQEAIRSAGQVVLVEGYLDAIRAHVGGFENVVASLGTAVTPQQLRLLHRFSSRVVLALDPDPAGQTAAVRAGLTALAEVTQARGRQPGEAAALDLRIATLEEGKGDPDDVIRSDPEAWKAALDASIPAFDFFFARTLSALDRAHDGWRQEAIDRILPAIQQFGSSAGWQAVWIERLSRETGVDIRLLQRSLGGGSKTGRQPRGRPRTAREQPAPPSPKAGVASNPALVLERALMAFLLKLVVVPVEALTELDKFEPAQPEHRLILDGLRAWQSSGNFEYPLLRDTLPDEIKPIADTLRELDVPVPEDGRLLTAVRYHAARIRHLRLEEELAQASSLLREISSDDAAPLMAETAELYVKKRQLEEELEDLSKAAARSRAGGEVF